MALWVVLLAADLPWLTDNNFTINGECQADIIPALINLKSYSMSSPFLVVVLQKILGLQIVWKHSDRIPAERHVLVSNHVTAGDLMVLYSLPQHYIHLISAQLPKRISQV